MPCWEVRTVSVEFKADNRKLVHAAAESLGMRVEEQSDGTIWLNAGEFPGSIKLDLERGQAEVRSGYQRHLNKLKQAYSRECVKTAAKKAGWVVKWSGEKAVVNKLKW